MPKNTPHTLYLCYFGLREPLVQTQVLPYLRQIRDGGVKVSVLTFEPNPKLNWTKQDIEDERNKLFAEGIEWQFLTYHKRPSAPATLFDVLCGAFFTWKKLRREKIDIVHARVHTPMLMAALAKTFTFGKKPKLLFDIRGFFPEEYTDAGLWKENGWLFRTVKIIEKWLLKKSDGFVVLTEKARQILFPESLETGRDKFGRPVAVIPCCVDLRRFGAANEISRREIRQQYNIENRCVIIYVGSFGGWYLTDEMLDFFEAAKEQNPQNFVLILTQRDKEAVAEKLRKKGFPDADFLVKSVSHPEIPKFVGASDVALSFIKACYSKLSSSPTKIAEYLASGVPIVANDGVGDITELIVGEQVGAIVKKFDKQSYFEALEDIDKLKKTGDLSKRCRTSAEEKFDLEKIGGAKYRNIYAKLLNE